MSSFFNNYMVNDLESYNLPPDASVINFPEGFSGDVSINTEWLLSQMQNTSVDREGWRPIWVTLGSSNVTTKTINRNLTESKSILGCERFLSFQPKFREWQVKSGFPNMSLDWHLNTNDLPHDPLYGIIGWFAKSTASNFNIGEQSYNLYIADGDIFSYADSALPRQVIYNLSLCSKTHISPTLWKKYQKIYSILTSNRPMQNTDGDAISFHQQRWLRKIAAVFASGPQLDGITQEILTDSNVLDFLFTETIPSLITSSTNEITAINKFLDYIDNNTSSTQLNGSIYENQINYSYISTKKELFTKLMSKYTAYLDLNKPSVISYPIDNGPHFYMNQVLTDHCDKNLKGTTVYNNIHFQAGPYEFKSNFSNRTTEYIIKGADKEYKIPTFDIAKNFQFYEIDKPIGVTVGGDVYIPVTKQGNSNLNEDNTARCEDGRLATGVTLPKLQLSTEYLRSVLGDAYFPFFDIDAATFSFKLISGPNKGIIFTENDLEQEMNFTKIGRYRIRLTVSIDTLSVSDEFSVTLVNKTGCIIGIDANGEIAVKDPASNDGGWSVDGGLSDSERRRFLGGGAEAEEADEAVDFIPDNYYSPTNESPVTFGRNRAKQYVNYIDNRKSVLTIQEIPVDTVKPLCPGVRQLMMSKYGVICPVKTNSYIAVDAPDTLPNDDGQSSGADTILRLDDATRFNKFFFKTIESGDNSTELKISYIPGNATMKLYRMNLESIRDGDSNGFSNTGYGSGSSTAKSPYQNFLYKIKKPNRERTANETKFYREAPGETSMLLRYNKDKAYIESVETYPSLEFGLERAPGIATFGGWEGDKEGLFENTPDYDQLKNYFISKGNVSYFPKYVKGHWLNYHKPGDAEFGGGWKGPPAICYLREAKVYSDTDSSNGYDALNPNIRFQKGTFDPSVGFLLGDNPYNNKTSSLKFNAGNKKSFLFKGPGFYNGIRGDGSVPIKEGKENINEVPQSVSMRSNITLNNNGWQAQFVNVEGSDGQTEIILDNPNVIEEFATHHGYRRLGGYGDAKIPQLWKSDEYEVSPGSYTFAQRGKRLIAEGRDQDGTLIAAQIKDVEVKLNFLNQVNLKDVKIKLSMRPSFSTRSRMKPKSDGISLNPTTKEFNTDPYSYANSTTTQTIQNFNTEADEYTEAYEDRSSLYDNIQHEGLAQYMRSLDLDNNITTDSFTLTLLNRENVDANTIDTCLRFSDRANKYNVPTNYNIYNSGLNLNQNITSTILPPSLSNPRYSMKEINEYSAMMRTNDFIPLSNTFAKFRNHFIFKGALEESDKEGSIVKPDSNTTFTLEIECFGDDDMVSLDTISNLASKLDEKPSENKRSSDSLFNSLCSWEVIIHTDTPKMNDGDSLGMINYGYAPDIPGHNYISTDPNIKLKLPKTVLDAPNNSLSDYSDCIFDDETRETIGYIRPPEAIKFPSAALAMALASIASMGLLGGVVGIMAAFVISLPSFSFITKMLSNIRRAEVDQALSDATVKSDYTKYGYGQSDKILLNVGSNKGIVYNLEAAIYRYSNTPILKQKVRDYVKPGPCFLPELGTFPLTELKDILDLFEPEDISKELADELKTKPSINSIPHKILMNNNIMSLDLESPQTMRLIPGKRAYNYFDVGQEVYDPGIFCTDVGPKFDLVSNLGPPSYSPPPPSPPPLPPPSPPSPPPPSSPGFESASYHEEEPSPSPPPSSPPPPVSLPPPPPPPKPATILAKGFILINGLYYTILQFNISLQYSSICLKPDENPNILVYSTVGDAPSYNHVIPASQTNNTLFPQLSYGSSQIVNSSFVSNQDIHNRLPTIYDIFNNQENNVKSLSRVNLFGKYLTKGDGSIGGRLTRNSIPEKHDLENYKGKESMATTSDPDNGSTTAVAGYSYNLFDLYSPISRTSSQGIELKTQDSNLISPNLQDLLTNIENVSDKHFNIVEIKSQKFSKPWQDVDIQGFATIENEFQPGFCIGLNSIQGKNGTIVTHIIDRLNFLNSTDSLVGDESFNQMSIPNLKIKIAGLQDDSVGCFLDKQGNAVRPSNLTQYEIDCPKTVCTQAFLARSQERTDLFKVLEEIGVKYQTDPSDNIEVVYSPYTDNQDIHSHKTYRFTNNTEQSKEPFVYNIEVDDDSYWINIDPRQKCKTSRDMSAKILVKAVYTCVPTVGIVTKMIEYDVATDNAQSICARKTASIEGPVTRMENRGNTFEYTFDLAHISRMKFWYQEKYGIPLNVWEEKTFPGKAPALGNGTITRSFFIRPGVEAEDVLVEVTETYLTPSENYFRSTIGLDPKNNVAAQWDTSDPSWDEVYGRGQYSDDYVNKEPYVETYGEYVGEVRDIIPDSILENPYLICSSRVIPRKLKNLDTHYEKYTYGPMGEVYKNFPSVGPGGPFTNILQMWHCVDPTKQLNNTEAPDYFKLQNEMIFRAYFGSNDNLEHKDNYVDSLETFEWTPYEYIPERDEN